ncbi:MAG: 4-hydroxy-3-methylbut-2-enyl diphosphate reductase, partial [Bacilli bacterium]|nr:4-hydroxy-3-methylbut-2-enyl diphosphate reductase [Bacilli bacterium]
MKVTLLKPIGFCQGVIKAISKAYQVKNANKDKNVFVLGKLVHNEKVIKDLESKGIFTLDVNNQNISEAIKKLNPTDLVILSAHGHSQYIEELLEE